MLLEKNGIRSGPLQYGETAERKTPWLALDFDFAGKTHSVLIRPADVQMEQGPQLFEPYNWRAGWPLESLIDEFIVRLDRYLDGGTWEGPPEDGLAYRAHRRLRPGRE